MKKFLTKNRALKKYKLKPEKLDSLIKKGTVTAYVLESCKDEPKTIVYDDDLAAYSADQSIKPEHFYSLRGNFLTLNAASRKYDVHLSAVSRWVRQGLLPYQAEKNKKLVDEADLAYLVNLSQAKKIRQGRKFTVPNVNT